MRLIAENIDTEMGIVESTQLSAHQRLRCSVICDKKDLRSFDGQ